MAQRLVGYHIVLIIARPQGQRGMVAQFQHHALHLFFNSLYKVVALRIEVTAHGKILPNQHAKLVAAVKEVAILIHISSPTPNHIDVKVGHHVHHLVYMQCVSAVQGVQRHPVCTVNEDGFTVYNKAETAGLLGRIHIIEVEFNRTKSYLLAVIGQHAPRFVNQFGPCFIQRLPAIAARPPQFGVVKAPHTAKGLRYNGFLQRINHLAMTAQCEARRNVVEPFHGH